MNKHTLHINQRELTAYLPAQHRPKAPTLLAFPDSPAEADALAAKAQISAAAQTQPCSN